jgi:hypothetical protein
MLPDGSYLFATGLCLFIMDLDKGEELIGTIYSESCHNYVWYCIVESSTHFYMPPDEGDFDKFMRIKKEDAPNREIFDRMWSSNGYSLFTEVPATIIDLSENVQSSSSPFRRAHNMIHNLQVHQEACVLFMHCVLYLETKHRPPCSFHWQ